MTTDDIVVFFEEDYLNVYVTDNNEASFGEVNIYVKDDTEASFEEDCLNVCVTDDYNQIDFPQPITPCTAEETARTLRVKVVAGEYIESYKVVYVKENNTIYKASKLDEKILNSKLAICPLEVDQGQEVEVILFGRVVNNDWNLKPSSYFLDIDGAITDQRPKEGILVKVGAGLKTNTLIFAPEQPIKLR